MAGYGGLTRSLRKKPGSYWKRPSLTGCWFTYFYGVWIFQFVMWNIYQSCFFFFSFFSGNKKLKNNLVHHLGGDIRNRYAAEILYEWFGWSKWWWMVCQTGWNHIFLRTAFSGRYLIICIPMIETVAAQAAEGSPYRAKIGHFAVNYLVANYPRLVSGL